MVYVGGSLGNIDDFCMGRLVVEHTQTRGDHHGPENRKQLMQGAIHEYLEHQPLSTVERDMTRQALNGVCVCLSLCRLGNQTDAHNFVLCAGYRTRKAHLFSSQHRCERGEGREGVREGDFYTCVGMGEFACVLREGFGDYSHGIAFAFLEDHFLPQSLRPSPKPEIRNLEPGPRFSKLLSGRFCYA